MVQSNCVEGRLYPEDMIRMRDAIDEAISKGTGPIEYSIGNRFGETSWDFRSTEMIEHRFRGSSADNADDYCSAYTSTKIEFD